jgi:hypothetical protein
VINNSESMDRLRNEVKPVGGEGGGNE